MANRVSLIASTYLLSREEPGFATVESQFDVEVERTEPASWSIPAGAARDLSATVDARPTPLTFDKDGQVATIPISGPGVQSIRVRGSVPLVTVGQEGERFRLPIVRSAFAGVEVARDARGHWVEVADAVGRVELQAGGIRGTIGPIDALEVRWFAADSPQPGGPRGPVEATMLWDARPVGDLLRVRLSHSDPEGASTLRLALEPGLLVRNFSIPDLVGIRSEGTIERPEWVAQIDPPWPRDVPIEVDFWRPRVPGTTARRLPRIETLDARRFSGVIGFRRPSDWSGRLLAGPGLDSLPESSFVRAWGTLPEDGLTLAGSVRFGPTTDPGVVTGPLPLRRVVRPTVLVEVDPGRLRASIEATLSDRQGRSFEVEVGIPPDFRIVRVESVGMVGWRRVARDRLGSSSTAPRLPIVRSGFRDTFLSLPTPCWSRLGVISPGFPGPGGPTPPRRRVPWSSRARSGFRSRRVKESRQFRRPVRSSRVPPSGRLIESRSRAGSGGFSGPRPGRRSACRSGAT